MKLVIEITLPADTAKTAIEDPAYTNQVEKQVREIVPEGTVKARLVG